ncbi:hypothetical protein ACMZ4W_01885 [Brevundimonas naejangsanensis]
MGRQRWIVPITHRAAVDTARLVSNSTDQGGEMPLAFAVIHDDCMDPGLGQSSLQSSVNILAQTRSHGHLDKVLRVQAHETLFDHPGSFENDGKAVWCPDTGEVAFLLGARAVFTAAGLGPAARLAASASISGRMSDAAAIWGGRPCRTNRCALTRRADRSVSLIKGSFSARGDTGASFRQRLGATRQAPPLQLVEADLDSDFIPQDTGL